MSLKRKLGVMSFFVVSLLISCSVEQRIHKVTIILYDDMTCGFRFNGIFVDVGSNRFEATVMKDIILDTQGYVVRCINDGLNTDFESNNYDLASAIYFFAEGQRLGSEFDFLKKFLTSENIYRCAFDDTFGGLTSYLLVNFGSQDSFVSIDQTSDVHFQNRREKLVVDCYLKEVKKGMFGYWI